MTPPVEDHGDGESQLANRSTAGLLADWAPLQAELARRFGNSNIVGCYGELLIAAAVGGRLRSNSSADGDVELEDGRVVEVKCRRQGEGAGRNASGVYKWDRSINGWPFHFAALVQLDESTLRPVRAFMLKAEELGEPKAFGTKSPVLGQQLYANRRYPGEIDLLARVGDGSHIELPSAPPVRTPTSRSPAQRTVRLDGRLCAVPGCNEPYMSRGLCRLHYGRAKLSGVRGDLSPETLAGLADGVIRNSRPRNGVCLVAACGKPFESRGVCANHYALAQNRGLWSPGRGPFPKHVLEALAGR